MAERKIALIYKLKKPVEFAGNVLTELHLEEPTFEHLVQIDGIEGELSKQNKLIKLLSQESPIMIDKMVMKDVLGVSAALEPFLH